MPADNQNGFRILLVQILFSSFLGFAFGIIAWVIASDMATPQPPKLWVGILTFGVSTLLMFVIARRCQD